MKWPTPQHCRVILLYAMSIALTRFPLGRVEKKREIIFSHCTAKRDCQIWTEHRGDVLSHPLGVLQEHWFSTGSTLGLHHHP